ncbi:BamA/TamA family outer membrane protein [bacterium]|nr:BamA/TamA family outer membrane protein [bacterium]
MRYFLTLLSIILLLASSVSAQNEFGKNKVRYNKVDWKVLKTEHFEVHHDKKTENLARMAASMAEEAYASISQSLRHQVTNPIPFIIFKSHYDFQQTNVITELISPGVGGFSEVMKFRMVIPFMGSFVQLKKVITHELTHVFTYDVLYPDGLESMLSVSAIPPMWFMEGLAEYETGIFDPMGHMMLVDTVVENCLDHLEHLTDFGMTDNVFLAYQESHSLLQYIAQTYGEEKVSILLRKFKKSTGLDETIKKALGVDTNTLETGWIKALRQVYYPEVAIRKLADDDNKQIFNQKIIPAAPAFSPGGDLAAVTVIRDGIPCLALMKSVDGTVIRYITEGMRGIRFDELSFKAGPAYSRDGSRIAFIAKCKAKDVIFLWDVFEDRLLKTMSVDLDNISSLCFAQDSDTILLGGLKNGESNVYRFNITTQGLEQITHGMNRQPAYSPVRNEIAFIREQGTTTELFVMDASTLEAKKLPLPCLPKIDPFWSPDGNIVYCSCLSNKVYNIWAVNLQAGVGAGSKPAALFPQTEVSQQKTVGADLRVCPDKQKAETQTPSSASPSKNPSSSPSATSASPREPSSSLSATFASPREPSSLYKIAQVTDYFGGAFHGGYMSDKFSFMSYIKGENAVYFREKPLDAAWIQPEEKGTETNSRDAQYPDKGLEIKKAEGSIASYKTRITFDWRKMDMVYNSVSGFAGIGELAMSDILGNHRFIWRGDASSSLAGDTNFILAYLYLGKRASYEVDISDWSNSYQFMDEEFKEKRCGISGNVSYPLDIFRRVELGLTSRRVVTSYTLPKPSTERENVNLVSADIIHDTTIWSWDGPVGGSRAMIGVSDTVKLSDNDLDFTNLEMDLRKYIKAGNRSAMAFQLCGKTSTGRNKTQFILDSGGMIMVNENGKIKRYDVYEFRGGISLRGTAFAKGSLELRFPLIDTIQFALPLSIKGIRSLVFFDVGAVWRDGKPPTYRKTDAINPIRGAFGWGIRTNLWIFPIRIDYAWGTDFVNPLTESVKHFSLGYDF